MGIPKLFAGKKELEKAYRQLGSTAKVAAYFGVSKPVILRHMVKHGIPRNKRGNPEEQAVVIVVLTHRGFSTSEIGEFLGIKANHVSCIARQFGIRIPDYYHCGYIKDKGYVMIYNPDHPQADCRGYVREHRLIMEKKVGHVIDKSILVHHEDKIKSNNDPDNLVMMTKGEHVSLHHTGKDGRNRRDIIEKDKLRKLQRPALVPVSS